MVDACPHPGTVLRRVLDVTNIKQAELAHHVGLSPKHVNQIVQGCVGITPEIAVAIGDATGIPAEVWAVLNAVHQVQVLTAGRDVKQPAQGTRGRRGACGTCGRSIAVRADGAIRTHGVCSGAGNLPAEEGDDA